MGIKGLHWPGDGTITWAAEDAGKPFTVYEFAQKRLKEVEQATSSADWIVKLRDELRALVAAPDRPLTPDDLEWAATARCRCGAGYCYPKFVHDMHGSWYCSACILGTATAGSEHDAAKPFAFWSIKGDCQPSANGATTRPSLCRACSKPLQPPESGLADCCPCNSGRGVNHGLVPPDCCTCVECDPAQTGASRCRSS